MAQIYLPEHRPERDQVQSSISVSDVTLAKGGEERPPRRLGALDLLMVLGVLGVVTLQVLAASHWMARLSPVVHIQLGGGMSPASAGYSLLHMLLAYLLSLLFTLVYGHSAARNRPVDLIYRIMTSPQTDSELLLEEEYPRPLTGPLTPPKPARPYQTLPHMAISDVTGLTELVLTAIGKRFAGADVLEEKQVFRQQALARIGMLRHIITVLKQDSEHTVSEERSLSQLQEHFSEDKARARLETVINWGGSAELFSSTEERGIFRLEAAETQEESGG